MSDLKQYGLIEKTKAGTFTITQEFKNAEAMAQDTPEFKAAAYEFAKRPTVFQSILAAAKGTLPDETALASTLRSTYQFNTEKAQTTAKAISESLAWAGVLDAKRNIIEPRVSESAGQNQSETPSGESTQDTASLEDRAPTGRLLTLEIRLADGRTAHVKYPQDLTEAEATKIGKVLAAICD